MKDSDLLQVLEEMRIEPDGAALTFATRLASENDWSHGYAERVFGEYRRFLFLVATSGQPMTPSDQVDQAWHMHLTYTRHYWDILCGKILERPLHHGPTLGGVQEDNRYLEQYARTIEAYVQAFGHQPPTDIWPDAKKRFSARFRRVAVGQHWMVPKKPAYAVIPLLTLAACSPVDWAAGGILAGLGLVLGTVAIAAIQAERGPEKRKGDNSSGCGAATSPCVSGDCGDSGAGDCSGGGGCGGGCGS